MPSVHTLGKYALISLASILLAACAGERDPAQKMISDIDATVAAASADAAKYAPDQLIDTQTKLGDLKASFGRQDYKAVLAAAPPVLAEAQGLSGAAAAKKAQVMQDRSDQWTSLSSTVPGSMAAIQSRIDLLSKKSSRKLAAGIDLAAAKSAVSDAASLWSKAQGAFGNGNLDEAVSAAKDVKARLDALAPTLKMASPAAAAPAA